MFQLVGQLSSHYHKKSTLDHERHGEVHQIMSPGEFHDKVRFDQMVTSVGTHSEKLFFLMGYKEIEQILDQLALPAFSGSLHAILILLVLFGQLNRIFEFLRFSVEEGSDPAHLVQLVVFGLFGQGSFVEVVEILN